MPRWLSSFLIALAVLASACSRLDPPEIGGELVVAIRADPVFFQGHSGIEHDLIQAFADGLGVKVRHVVARDEAEAIEWVRTRKAHFAAAVATPPVNDTVRLTSPLREARLVMAQHADSVETVDDGGLTDRSIEVQTGSPALRALRPMQVSTTFTIGEIDDIDQLGLLSRVSERIADLVVVDRVHFDVGATYYPDLIVADELNEKVVYAWAFHAQDAALLEKANGYIARIVEDGTLRRLEDRYFGHIKRLRPNDIAQFMERAQTRLPHYRALFHEAELLTGIDWRLLAALAYQESQWDPLATSPTGVRGMMMLTEETADRMRVSNRLDPRQSIRAGARYLQDLIDSLPVDVAEPDRTWLALAAYNIGPGHFGGAVAIAKGLNYDPASWYDMKRVLPLLAQERYYSRLKSGRARGGEAVILVENVRNFQDILIRLEPAYVPVVKPPK